MKLDLRVALLTLLAVCVASASVAQQRGSGSRSESQRNATAYSPFDHKIPSLVTKGSLERMRHVNSGGALGGNWRYLDNISPALDGKHFLVYDFTRDEANGSLSTSRYMKVKDEDRVPTLGISILDGKVLVRSKSESEINQIQRFSGNDLPKEDVRPECFYSDLTVSGPCITIVKLFYRSSRDSRYFQTTFLASIGTRPLYSRGNLPALSFRIGAYVKEVSERELQSTFSQQLLIAKQRQQENERAVRSGQPKPHMDFSFVPDLWAGAFERIYLRDADRKAAGKPSINDQLIFMSFYQAFSDACRSSFSGDSKVYNHMDRRVVDSDLSVRYGGLFTTFVTTNYYRDFVAKSVSLPAEDAAHYQRIASSFPARLLVAGSQGDVPFTQYLSRIEQRGAQIISASKAFISREGCDSPTMAKFRSGLRAPF